MPFDLYVFDLDGTLVDTAPDLAASMNHALTSMGRDTIPIESVRNMVGHGARKLLEHGLAATGAVSPELVEQGVPAFLAHYAANIATGSRPFAGVEAALKRLAGQGARLAICTNKPEALARSLIAALGWEGRFAALLGADSRPWRKPDPRHLHDTIAEAGGGRTLFVGDSRTDADTAHAAGVPLMLVSFGYSAEPVAAMCAAAIIDHYDAFDAAARAIQSKLTGAAAGGCG
jgi:phosphoglycolate phosphatase